MDKDQAENLQLKVLSPIFDGETCATLLELIDRATKTKPISYRWCEEQIGKVGYDHCPNCGNIVGNRFCSFCGQAILWEETEEEICY